MKWMLYIVWTFCWVFIVNFLIFGELIMPCISNPLVKIFTLSCSTAILVAGFIFIHRLFGKGEKLSPTTCPDKKNEIENTGCLTKNNYQKNGSHV